MERHLSRDRGAGLVGSDVETAGTERQRFGEHLQRGASLGVKQTLCRFIIADAAKRQRPARGLRPEINDPFHASLSPTRVVSEVSAHMGQLPARKYGDWNRAV